MVKRKKIKMGILIAAAAFLLAAVAFIAVRLVAYNQTSFPLEFASNGDFISQLPIPQGTRYAGGYKINSEKFKTLRTREEVIKFYQDYFNKLPRVSIAPSRASGPTDKAYYDEKQKLIVYDNISFQEKWDGLYYIIWFDPYGDGAGIRIAEKAENHVVQS